MTVNFRKHSTLIGHIAHCKCETCTEVDRYNQKLNRAGYRRIIPAEPAKNHLWLLHRAAGKSLEPLFEAIDVEPNTLKSILYGERTGLERQIAAAILAVSPEDIKARKYPIQHYIWRLGVLAAQGFSIPTLERMCGKRIRPTRGTRKNLEFVTADKWEALNELWVSIGDRYASPETDGVTQTEINRIKGTATKKGFKHRNWYDTEFGEPEDVREGRALIAQDRRDLETMIEGRVRAGQNRAEIRDELQHVYPDVRDWKHIVENAQKRVNRAARD